MHIAGIVVRTRPQNLDQVQQQLNDLGGIEIHATTDEGNVVVTIESDDRKWIADKIFEMDRMPDVLSAAMVYESSEYAMQAEESRV